jgi:hypothetical protein
VLLAGKVSAAAVGGGITFGTGVIVSSASEQAKNKRLIHKIPRYFIA